MESFFATKVKGKVKAPPALDPYNKGFPLYRLFEVVRAAAPEDYDTAGAVGFVGSFWGERCVVWLCASNYPHSPGYDSADVLDGAQLRFLEPSEIVELRNE